MSFYSSIDRRINADRWFRSLSHMAQLLWFRLLTGQHVTPVAGLWPATEEGLSRAFLMPRPTFRRHYEELAGKPGNPTGKVHADWEAGVIWFPKAIHVPANQPRNENTLRGWVKHIELVPECDLRDVALTEIAEWVKENTGEKKRFPGGLPPGFPVPKVMRGKPLHEPNAEQLPKLFPELLHELSGEHVPRANQDQEQDQKQEQKPPGHRPDVFGMHPDWRPTPDVIRSFEVALIPKWAIEALISRHRSAFTAKKSDKRTDEEWNESCSKWVHGDWSNPQKRPKKPAADEKQDETDGYGPAGDWA
jgi:hypothetical protein